MTRQVPPGSLGLKSSVPWLQPTLLGAFSIRSLVPRSEHNFVPTGRGQALKHGACMTKLGLNSLGPFPLRMEKPGGSSFSTKSAGEMQPLLQCKHMQQIQKTGREEMPRSSWGGGGDPDMLRAKRPVDQCLTRQESGNTGKGGGRQPLGNSRCSRLSLTASRVTLENHGQGSPH